MHTNNLQIIHGVEIARVKRGGADTEAGKGDQNAKQAEKIYISLQDQKQVRLS